MASKFFCCCCHASKGSSTAFGSRPPSTPQQHQPRALNLNMDPRRNGLKRRYPRYVTNNWVLRVCTLGRP
ncbi:unnamed protein product [Nyctereutes procyonoides]|uniref:(raccoon dog) hypothetical protein n=1 Tax=Nyctereutes procyonoides TaxID=34880 RepID=A0A811ZFC7_NYCPR|nr:unnamed protein product [Nyctereutes procyonoides]